LPNDEGGGPKTARNVVIRPSRCPNPSEVYAVRTQGRPHARRTYVQP
jgi:hypothetical protein